MAVTKKKVVAKKAAVKRSPVATRTPARAPREELVTHQDNRASRNTETWDEHAVHDDFDDFVGQDTALPNIPEQFGFDQRWIRTMIGGEPDPVNVSRAFSKGWKRRDPDTLPANFRALRSYQEGIGDSVGVSGMVLMERPKQISQKFKDAKDERTKSQMDSVDDNLFKEHTAGSGFGAPKRVEDKTEVTRGKPISVDDD